MLELELEERRRNQAKRRKLLGDTALEVRQKINAFSPILTLVFLDEN